MVILLDNQASIVRIVQATDVYPEIEKSGVRLDLDDTGGSACAGLHIVDR